MRNTEPVNQYKQAAEILFASILREPHIFAQVSHKMHPVWFSETRYKGAAVTLWKQHHSQTRQYSTYSICDETAPEAHLIFVQSQHIETPLQLAFDMFVPIYRRYVEYKCTLVALEYLGKDMDAETIRRKQDEYRQNSMAYLTDQEPTNAALENWIETKLSGNEPDHICKPSLKTLINNGHLRGFEGGDYVLIIGRPGMGKTHFVLDQIHNFAKAGARGVFISLDMSTLQIQKRMVGKLTGVNPVAKWTQLTPAEIADINKAKEYLTTWPVVMLDTVRNIDELVSIIYAENYKEPLCWIVVDYIQQIQKPVVKMREQEVAQVSMTLKHMGKVLNIPVIALAQLSRSVETRGGDKRPIASDMRDTGQLEQDATIIIAPYRAEYYNILEDDQGNSTVGKAEIIFLKNQKDGLYKPSVVGFDGIKGFFDLTDNFEQSYFAKEVPAMPQAVFNRPKNDDDIPF
jgi:replicative DNA helicase